MYKVTCMQNNKIYVGQTTWTLLARWKQHIHHAVHGRRCALHNAIRKYGKENFITEVLEECAVTELDARETYWIEHLHAYVPTVGYNRTFGGQRGKLTAAVRAQLSILHSGSRNPMSGKHHTVEVRARMSAKRKGRTKSPEWQAKITASSRRYWQRQRLLKDINYILQELDEAG